MKVDRTVVAKVPALTIAPVGSSRPGTTVLVAPWPSVAGVSLPARKMPSLASIPILHDISSDDEEEVEEKEKGDSKGSEDVKVDGSSSSSDSSDSGVGDDDDDDDRDESDD